MFQSRIQVIQFISPIAANKKPEELAAGVVP